MSKEIIPIATTGAAGLLALNKVLESLKAQGMDETQHFQDLCKMRDDLLGGMKCPPSGSAYVSSTGEIVRSANDNNLAMDAMHALPWVAALIAGAFALSLAASANRQRVAA